MRKFLFLAALAVLLPTLASAAPADIATLKAYAARALSKCPDAKLTIEPIDREGPMGFLPYLVTLTSSDSTCGRQTHLLYSPTTQQVIMGTIIELPGDSRSVDVRVAEKAMELMKRPLTATVSKFPLPDRIKAVSIVKQTEYGPFAFHGYVDASERFLIIGGSRGSLLTPPSKTLRDALHVENGVRRGNPKAKSQIIELSDFECPTCRRAHLRIEPVVEKNLAKVDYIRLDLPLFEMHEWAFPAAMAGRAIQRVAPKEYWKYVNFVYEHQEEIGKRKFDEFIREYCQDRDINWAAVEKIYRSPTEHAALLDQVSRAFDAGIVSTPTYIVNGQIMGFGPEGKYTEKMIKDALGVK